MHARPWSDAHPMLNQKVKFLAQLAHIRSMGALNDELMGDDASVDLEPEPVLPPPYLDLAPTSYVDHLIEEASHKPLSSGKAAHFLHKAHLDTAVNAAPRDRFNAVTHTTNAKVNARSTLPASLDTSDSLSDLPSHAELGLDDLAASAGAEMPGGDCASYLVNSSPFAVVPQSASTSGLPPPTAPRDDFSPFRVVATTGTAAGAKTGSTHQAKHSGPSGLSQSAVQGDTSRRGPRDSEGEAIDPQQTEPES